MFMKEQPTSLACSECGTDLPVESGYALPKWGFLFAPRDFGYYAGFSDNMPSGEIRKEEEVFFCHDCCLRLLDAFPSIARSIGEGGHHPCDDEVPCCRYAWQGTENFGKRHKELLSRTRHASFDEATQRLQWVDDEPEVAW